MTYFVGVLKLDSVEDWLYVNLWAFWRSLFLILNGHPSVAEGLGFLSENISTEN